MITTIGELERVAAGKYFCEIDQSIATKSQQCKSLNCMNRTNRPGFGSASASQGNPGEVKGRQWEVGAGCS